MAYIFGSLITAEGDDPSLGQQSPSTEKDPVSQKVESASRTPMETTAQVEQGKGFLGTLNDWLWGSAEDTASDKVTAVSTPQFQDITAAGDDEYYEFANDDDDDGEFYDFTADDDDGDADLSADDELSGNSEKIETVHEEDQPAKEKSMPRLNYQDRGFGPPMSYSAGYLGMTAEQAQEFERQMIKAQNEKEADSRGWGGFLANLATQYIPGTGMLIRNDWARGKIKSQLLGNTDFAALSQELRRELRILTGDSKLSTIAEKTAEKLKAKILADLTDNTGRVKHNYPGFKEFLDLEDELMGEVFKSILLKAVLNIAKNTKERLGPDFNGNLTTEILCDLTKVTNGGLDEVSAERFEEISKVENINDRKKQYRELFKPLAESLITIAFPNGKEDLQLGNLSDTVWSAIAGQAIPDLFTKVYTLTHAPTHHKEEDLKELERPGGAALKSLAAYIAGKTKERIPGLLEKNVHEAYGWVLSNVLDGSDDLPWFQGWLETNLKDISKSDDPAITRLWEYAEKNVESIIIHALATLARNADSSEDTSDKNIVPDLAGNGLKILEDFFTENKKDIDQAFKETENLPKEEREQRLNAKFKPLSDKILAAAGLDDNPFVASAKDEKLPAYLREFYADMYLYTEDLTQDSEKLKDRLLDPVAHINQASEAMVEEYSAFLANPDEGKKVLWDKSGIGKVVDELESSCGEFAKDIVSTLKSFTEKDKTLIAEKLNTGLLSNSPLSEEEQKALGDGLHQFFNAGGEGLEKTWGYSETIIKAALFKVFAAVADNQQIDGEDDRKENKNTALVGNVIHRVLSFLNNRIPSIDAQLKKVQANTEMTEEEKNAAIRKLYQPLAEDFLSLAGDDIESILPVPVLMRGPVNDLLKTTLLPTIFHEMYTKLNAGREEAPEQAKKLDAAIPSGSKFVQNVSDFIEKFVPYYMETNPEVISEIAVKACGKYTKGLSPKHQQQLSGIVAKNVEMLGKDEEMAKTSKAVAEYSKALMLKVFAGIATSIKDKESVKDKKGQNHFFLNTSIGFISLLSGHFKRINKIPPEGRMFPAHLVRHEDMVDGFSDAEHYETDMLHPALAKDFAEGATEEDKKQQRLNEFFVPFAKDILHIAGMKDANSLAIPEPLREEVWNLFQTKLLPEIMMNLFGEVMKPESLNLLMLKTFDALNEAVDDLGEVDLTAIDEDEEIDEQQEKLNEAIGTLVKEMVELVPDFWTMTVFNSEKIKNMTAASLGKVVRRKLDDTTMLNLLNKGLSNITMPKPGADRGKTDAEKAKENKRIEKELNQKMTAYISKQAKEKFRAYLNSKWDNFHDSFDKGIEKYLGKPGLAIKHFFDDILHFIFFDVLGPVFDFIVFKVLWFFVDMKIAEKTREIIKNVQMPIHENLVYNLCDAWTKSMKGQHKVEETKTELIQAFEKNRKEQEEAARALKEKKLQDEKKAREEQERIANEKLVKERVQEEAAKIPA